MLAPATGTPGALRVTVPLRQFFTGINRNARDRRLRHLPRCCFNPIRRLTDTFFRHGGSSTPQGAKENGFPRWSRPGSSGSQPHLPTASKAGSERSGKFAKLRRFGHSCGRQDIGQGRNDQFAGPCLAADPATIGPLLQGLDDGINLTQSGVTVLGIVFLEVIADVLRDPARRQESSGWA